MAFIGVPIKILHEAEGHVVTCETTTGEMYRGKLVEAEDNMNIQISNVSVTLRDGSETKMDYVFIRGSKIRFMSLPDMLKNAPMFKIMKQKPAGMGVGMGRGKVRGRGGFGGRGGGGRGGFGGRGGGRDRQF